MREPFVQYMQYKFVQYIIMQGFGDFLGVWHAPIYSV